MPSTVASVPDRMHCMEVWGGNSPVDRSFAVTGLKVWVYSRPYERATSGGDVYYVSSCASGRITRLLLADVSGHGEEVAEVATALRDLMRRNVNFINQTRFVREMNREFSEPLADEVFATAVVCTFFAPTRSLQFCNAGHPIPYLYRAQEGSWASAHDVAGVTLGDGLADTPLGVMPDADYSRFETKLSPGDMVLCVSDAFTEADDGQGGMLGTDGLLQVVQGLDSAQPDEVIPQLLDRLNLRSSEHQQDDATALLFRADGSTPTLSDNLLAPVRLLSGVRDNTGLEHRD